MAWEVLDTLSVGSTTGTVTFLNSFLFLVICVCECSCPQRSEEDVRFPEAEVRGTGAGT